MSLKEILKPKPLILFVLKEKGPLSGPEIERETGLSRNAVYYNLKELLNERLVAKRNGKYEITETGRELLRKVVEVVG